MLSLIRSGYILLGHVSWGYVM